MYPNYIQFIDKPIRDLIWVAFWALLVVCLSALVRQQSRKNTIKHRYNELTRCFQDSPGFYLFAKYDPDTGEPRYKLVGTGGVTIGEVVANGTKLSLVLGVSVGAGAQALKADLYQCLDGTWADDSSATIQHNYAPPAVSGCPGWRKWLDIDTAFTESEKIGR